MFEENINYRITKNLIKMLQGLSGHSEKEVWAKLAEATQVCIERIKKKNMSESWRWFQYENTSARMKVKVRAYKLSRDSSKIEYSANITLDTHEQESFTSSQVRDYLIEEVLLGEIDV